MKSVFKIVAVLFVAFGLTACQTNDVFAPEASKRYSAGETGLTKEAYTTAESLMRQATEKSVVSKTTPLVVATFADINDIESAAPLGRVISEQVSTKLVQMGYNIVEVNLRESINVNKNGEFMLTRNQQDLTRIYNVAAIIAGHYAKGENGVHFNTRMVGASDGKLIAAHDFVLPYESDVRALLKKPSRGGGEGSWFNSNDVE